MQLANHNTVLLLTNTQTPTVHVQCLTPTGQPAWEADLDRYQQRGLGFAYALFSPLQGKLLTRQPKDFREREATSKALDLDPLEVFTTGNEVLLVERIREEVAKKQPTGSSLVAGQLHIHHLDEGGRLTTTVFAPRPTPESRKITSEVLGSYAEAGGFAEIVREVDKREAVPSFFVHHYDLRTKAMRREPLALPAPPKEVKDIAWDLWYRDWTYLGHRANQTYFYRLTLTDADQPKQSAGDRPVAYQVYIADDQGAAAGGFTTLLGLPKGLISLYAGKTDPTGEARYIPELVFMTNRGQVDTWKITVSGFGAVQLDPMTGDVLIFGEFGQGTGISPDTRELTGIFGRRYSAQGQTLASVEHLYTKAFQADKPRYLFKGGGGATNRSYSYLLDPLDGQSHYGLSHIGSNYALIADLSFDKSLKPLHQQSNPFEADKNALTTTVLYAEPHWLYKFTDTKLLHSYRAVRSYEHAAPTDLPIYAALE